MRKSALQLANLSDVFEEFNGKTAENVEIPDFFYRRHRSNLSVMDSLLGGSETPGFRPCTLALFAAQRGCGKTTILLQYLSSLAENGVKVAFFSNEETVPELAILAKRVAASHNVPLFSINDVNEILNCVQTNKFDVIVIDSFNGLDTEVVQKNKSTFALSAIINRMADYKNFHNFSALMCCHMNSEGNKIKIGGSDAEHSGHIVMTMTKAEEGEFEVNGVRKILVSKNRTGKEEKLCLQMTSSGFDFENLHEPTELNSSVDGRSAEKVKRFDKISDLVAQGSDSLEQLVQALGVSEITVRNDLRSLESSGILKKTGRGKTSKWEKISQ